ncbi:hypothetical protein EJB05_25351, partial [Eragrostis curvula]
MRNARSAPRSARQSSTATPRPEIMVVVRRLRGGTATGEADQLVAMLDKARSSRALPPGLGHQLFDGMLERGVWPCETGAVMQKGFAFPLPSSSVFGRSSNGNQCTVHGQVELYRYLIHGNHGNLVGKRSNHFTLAQSNSNFPLPLFLSPMSLWFHAVRYSLGHLLHFRSMKGHLA